MLVHSFRMVRSSSYIWRSLSQGRSQEQKSVVAPAPASAWWRPLASTNTNCKFIIRQSWSRVVACLPSLEINFWPYFHYACARTTASADDDGRGSSGVNWTGLSTTMSALPAACVIPRVPVTRASGIPRDAPTWHPHWPPMIGYQ